MLQPFGWRQVLTVVLMLVTLPVFLVSAAAAVIVGAPLLVIFGVVQALRSFHIGPEPERAIFR